MNLQWKTLTLLWFMVVALDAHAQAGVEVPAKDWRGSKDHPLISRFAGAVISGYEVKDYDQLVLQLGKYRYRDGPVEQQFDKYQTVEGKVTRIAYAIPRGKSGVEIFRNYQQALSRAGFKFLFTCETGPGCDSDFANAIRQKLVNRGVGDDNVVIWTLSGVGGEVRHLTASLKATAGEVYVTVTVCQNAGPPPGVLVQIVETKAMQTNQVFVDAKAITTGLQSDGKIALYGLTFDTDSAVIKPESASTLLEMAKAFEGSPGIKAYIVGHTDNVGSLMHNLELSQRRAEAVVNALITRHHIAANRLVAKGLASLSPVASNHDETGRAKNRRVELVEQ